MSCCHLQRAKDKKKFSKERSFVSRYFANIVIFLVKI